MTNGQANEKIPTNLRLLLVLEAVAQAGIPVTPTEVNAKIGLPKPTIHRLFATLEAEGFLEKNLDGRSYVPGYRYRKMATGVLSSVRVRDARLTILRKLSTHIGETCNIALPERDAMVYLERVETEWPLRIQLPVGTAVPLYCTATGKMYLSALPKAHLARYAATAPLHANTPNTLTDPEALIKEITAIRKNGYSVDNEEFMEGMIALAVPVLDANGRLVATISFHAPTLRFTIERAMQFLPAARASAAELTSLLND